jgi:cytochrome c peroxidase
MVRILGIFFVLHVSLFANVYETNCVSCHEKMPVKIDKFFYRYLLKYSSEENVKNALFAYLKNPTKEKTILQEGLQNRFGIKEKTTLKDTQLKSAIDIYWDTYKIFGKLR